MKQHITKDQWAELDFPERDKLRPFLEKNNYPFEMSIGEMIEFLEEKDINFRNISLIGLNEETWDWTVDSKKAFPELADALWEAVKSVL